MKIGFQESINQRTDAELSRIAKDFYFYSAEERLLAMNELKSRNTLPKELQMTKKHIANSVKVEEKNKKRLSLPMGWLITLIMFSFIYLVLIIAGFIYQNIDLRDTIRREGVVESVGVFTSTTQSTGRIFELEQQFFYIQFSDRSEKMQVFRRSFNYDDLLENIQIGDRLTVFLMPHDQRSEMIQIEKNGNIILHRNEIQTRNRILIYIGFLGLLGNVAIFFWLLRKQRKEEKEKLED